MVSRRRSVRTWRLRGRRGQVSAVATILGLLLVVTFIANYLTTTLPGQMSVNDLNHVVQVEDQVGRLSALLEAASAADAVGAQFSQPITLGSAGTPPFAGADAGSLGPVTNGSEISLSVPVGGAWSYSAPTVGTLGYSNPGGGCSQATNSVTCTGTSTASTLYWNVSGTKVAYSLTGTDGTYNFNVADSGTSTAAPATITLTLSGGTMNVLVLGNNLSIPTKITAGGNVNFEVVGNNDNITVTATATGADVSLFEVGLNDQTYLADAAGLNFLGNIAGTTDYVSVATGTADLSSATIVSVYYLSDNPSATACPNGDGASSDYVLGGHAPTTHPTHSYGEFSVTYNVTTLPITLSNPPSYAIWDVTNNSVTAAAANCPLFAQASVPLSLGGQGSGLQVFLQNTYIASGDVALDEGAVAYGQEGSVPVMVDPPDFSASLSSTGALATASIWIPVFVGTIPVDYGISTSEFTMRLVSVSSLSFVSGSSLALAVGGIVNITVVSPYAAAWHQYLTTTSPWEFFTPINCYLSTEACDGPYVAGGPLGAVSLDLPITSAFSTLTVQVATFSVAVV